MDFSGSVVLVTGGSRGIGRGISEAFLGHGADVVICGRNEPDELPSSGGREARFVAADVRDATAVDALISDIEATEGRLDVVVNNAGGAPHVDAAEVSPRFHEAIIALNLTAPDASVRRRGCPVPPMGSAKSGILASPNNRPPRE